MIAHGSGRTSAKQLPRALVRRIGGPFDLRHQHLAEVLWHLREHGPSSRAAIASGCNLGTSTLTDLVYELKRRQLIKELPAERQRRGRPRQPLALNDAMPWSVVGVHVDDDGVRSAAATLGGASLGDPRLDPQAIPSSLDQLDRHLIAILRQHVARIPRRAVVVGVGVAVSSAVVARLGTMDTIIELVTSALHAAGLPQVSLTVAGEAQLEALHAVSVARADRDQTVLYVGGGRSIHSAVISEGQIRPGRTGNAGGLAHLPTVGNHPCHCGRFGCLDTLASLPALLLAAGADYDLVAGPRRVPDSEAIAWLNDQARRGAPAALAALDAAGAALGKALQAASMILDPDAVIIGGHLGGIHARLTASVNGSVASRVPLAYLKAGEASALMGAIVAAQDACLSEPLVWTDPALRVIDGGSDGPDGADKGELPRAEIIKIAVDRTGGRSAVVRSPHDPRMIHRHGLGEVGREVAPYLGPRTGHGDHGGYEIVLPADRGSLYVYQTDQRRSGRGGAGIERKLPWTALDAPDLPNRFAHPEWSR